MDSEEKETVLRDEDEKHVEIDDVLSVDGEAEEDLTILASEFLLDDEGEGEVAVHEKGGEAAHILETVANDDDARQGSY